MNTEISITPEIAIANLNQKKDLGLRYYAAWWLGKFRVKSTEAVDGLINALGDYEDRGPDGGFPLRRNAAKALGKLEDLRAVEHLIKCFECDDYYVRESAAQGLEMLGDKRAIEPLMSLLSNSVNNGKLTPYAFEAVIGKPYLNQPYEAIIEALGTLKAKQAEYLIKPFLDHPTKKIVYGAARAMYQLTNEDVYGEILVSALAGEELQLRRSALMDLGAIGYVKSGDAISQVYAENSLKLIAMKGLLESQVKQDSGEKLSDDSIKLMEIMDGLL